MEVIIIGVMISSKALEKCTFHLFQTNLQHRLSALRSCNTPQMMRQDLFFPTHFDSYHLDNYCGLYELVYSYLLSKKVCKMVFFLAKTIRIFSFVNLIRWPKTRRWPKKFWNVQLSYQLELNYLNFLNIFSRRCSVILKPDSYS